MIKVITESPSWLIIFCILFGALLSWVLYRKETLFNESHPVLKRILMTFRFLFITLLSFLLLTPLIKTITRRTEKPVIIIAQDNSQSVVVGKDSSFYKNEYPQRLKSLVADLSKKYDVKTLSFGDHINEQLDFSYSDKQTDYSKLFDEIDIRYANRNVGAIIFATDGLYNSGSNPLYHAGAVHAPVFAIALGDTNTQKDLRINNVRANKIAFLNSTFPVEIVVEARQCPGESTTLTVFEDSTQLFSKSVTISGNKFQQMIPVYIDAKKKGIHHYRISLSSVSNEVTLVNNVKDIYVEVQESKRKILIVADSPHPDLAALKGAIESNENYEVKTQIVDRFDANLNEYQAVILHQLPSVDHPATEIIQKINQGKIPAWFILGSQTNVNAFNTVASGITIRGNINKTNDAQPVVSNNFSMFTVNDETRNSVRSFPPLLTPFGEYKQDASGSAFLVQKIGSIETSQPLLFLSENSQSRSAVLCGEGIWRWRMNDYQLNENFNSFNEIVSKTIQFLSSRENKSHFKIISKNSFPENEAIVIDAEVYNETFELVNTPDISITITNKEGKSFPFTFSKTEKAYTLNAGLFAPGNYHYKASVKSGEKVYAAEGDFSVNALQVEQTETTADHQLLYALAQKSGGELFYPNQMDDLIKKLETKEDIKTVSYSQVKLVDLVNVKWFFFLLLAFLSVEWFIRKRSGSY